MTNIEMLESIKARMERIAGSWNGDNSGIEEDRAHAASDAIEYLDALKEILKELDE